MKLLLIRSFILLKITTDFIVIRSEIDILFLKKNRM